MRIIKSAAALGRRELHRLGLWSPEGEGRTVANTRLLVAILVVATVGTIFGFEFPMMVGALLIALVGLHLNGSTHQARTGATSELHALCLTSTGGSWMFDAASVQDVLAGVQKRLGEGRVWVVANTKLVALGRWEMGDGEEHTLIGTVGDEVLTVTLMRPR